MKNIFSIKLYLAGIRKIKTAGIAAAITVIALNALAPIVGILESNITFPGTVRVSKLVSASGFSPFSLLMMVFGGILIYSMFSFMNERNQSDFWHAIPQKRICVYFSLLAAVWTWLLGVIVASALVNVILWAFAKYYVVSAAVFFSTIGVYFLASVLTASFMMIAMTITGTTMSNLLVASLLTFFFRIMSAIFVSCLRDLAPILDVSHSFWRILSVSFFLPFALLGNLFSTNLGPFGDMYLLLYTIALSIVLVGLGAVGYCFRKSETAAKSAPNKILQHTYRCAVTLPMVFLLAALIVMGEANESLCFVLVTLSLIIWVLFEVLTTKRIKNVLKSLPFLFIPVVVSALLCGGVFIARNIVFSQAPESHEIKGVSVGSLIYGNGTYEQIAEKNLVITDESVKLMISDSLKDSIREARENRNIGDFNDHFIIHLKSGTSFGRYLSLNSEENTKVLNLFYASDAYREAVLKLPKDSQIQSVECSNIGSDPKLSRLIWESFVAEYNALSAEQKRAIKEHSNGDKILQEEDKGFWTAGTIIVNGHVGMQQYQSQYPIFCEYTPKTAQLYLEVYASINSFFGNGVISDITKFHVLTGRVLQEEEGYIKGLVKMYTLAGNVEMNKVDFYFEEGEKEKQKLNDLFSQLITLSAPTDYRYEKGKTIVFLGVDTEVKGEFLLDNDLEDYAFFHVDSDEYYYVSCQIPIALTEEESNRVLTWLASSWIE